MFTPLILARELAMRKRPNLSCVVYSTLFIFHAHGPDHTRLQPIKFLAGSKAVSSLSLWLNRNITGCPTRDEYCKPDSDNED